MQGGRKRPAETQEEAWISGEDRFVLRQAKIKASKRVREGRARPIDTLAVTLRYINPSSNFLGDESEDDELPSINPETIFEDLDKKQLEELQKDINTYTTLETNKTNLDFWRTMEAITKDREEYFSLNASHWRARETVTPDIDKLLSAKSIEELVTLEKQIKTKLESNEPIDYDYWEGLLSSLTLWKAKAKLRSVSQSFVAAQEEIWQQEERDTASTLQKDMLVALSDPSSELYFFDDASSHSVETRIAAGHLDPTPMLQIQQGTETLKSQGESKLLRDIETERKKILRSGVVPRKLNTKHPHRLKKSEVSHTRSKTKPSQAQRDAFHREATRGMDELEEVFAGEEQLVDKDEARWDYKYRPRKPRYFNRVQMGYEWNKYNQTHFDHDNPPPKIVQGYKFNVFYPELIDKSEAPTYKIFRENGRKKGQSFAKPGEEDICVIKFMAGPPYEDIAFRIVDKEWDYSARRDKGFRCSFDKGILSLHFNFKKIFYRK